MNSKILRNEIVIDWKYIFLSVLKKWWLILICLAVGTAAGLGLGIKADVPVYECSAVYVLSYSGGDSVASMSSEYGFLSRILYNCTEVLKQNTFTKIIADEINAGVDEESKEYIPEEALAKCITYSYSNQGTMIYVTVDTGDAELSYRIISSVIDHLQSHIKSEYRLAGIDSMVFSLVNTPELPEEPLESRTRMLFTLIGAAAFTFICVAVIAFIAMMDTRIKKEDDIKNRFNAPVLGTIPDYTDPELYKEGYYNYATQSKSQQEQ